MVNRVTDSQKYKCTLSQESQQMAEQELRETPAARDHALKAISEWIEKHPRILAMRFDNSFLLRFLRAKKFSLPITQECIERYLLLRKLYEGAIFENLDYQLPTIIDLINLGYIFAVPKRDKLGRRVVLTRPGVFDPFKNFNFDLLKMHAICYETLLEDEESQVRGFVHIVDATGITLPYLTLFTPKQAVRIVKNTERTLPMRHKEINAINVHPSLKIAVDFGLSLVSEKMRNRIRFYTSLSEADNIDCSLLPKEYGGEMPMAEMIELWKKELAAVHHTLKLNDSMKLRLEMYSEKAREGAISALREPFACSIDNADNTVYGIQGSFRKLEVD